MRDEVVVLSTSIVESLARVSYTYRCALVDDIEVVEQGNEQFDLEETSLPDGRRMYTYAQKAPPKTAADDYDGRTVLAFMQKIDGSLWFKTKDDFDVFAIEVEGVTEGDGRALMEVDELFMSGELAASFYTTVVTSD